MREITHNDKTLTFLPEMYLKKKSKSICINEFTLLFYIMALNNILLSLILCADILPPCNSTIASATESPMPLPPVFLDLESSGL